MITELYIKHNKPQILGNYNYYSWITTVLELQTNLRQKVKLHY